MGTFTICFTGYGTFLYTGYGVMTPTFTAQEQEMCFMERYFSSEPNKEIYDIDHAKDIQTWNRNKLLNFIRH